MLQKISIHSYFIYDNDILMMSKSIFPIVKKKSRIIKFKINIYNIWIAISAKAAPELMMELSTFSVVIVATTSLYSK